MSMSLPERANLEFLKKQSKDLQRAFAAGEAEAVSRIHQYLPRARSLAQDQLVAMELSLQEAQHALACAYGFARWEALTAAVEAPGFGDLAKLTDREIQILLREVDQKVLVTALVDAPPNIVERFLQNMSERVRGFIRTEIDFLGSVPAADVAAARQQLTTYFVEEAADIAAMSRELSTEDLAAVLQEKPMRAMTLAQLVDFFRDLAILARRRGLQALVALIDQVQDDAVMAMGLAMIVQPDMSPGQFMERAGQQLQDERVALRRRHCLVIKGMAGIQAGRKPDALIAEAREWAQMQAQALPMALTPQATLL
ncbi:MAG: hypothetical protein O2782_19735 [bacterium]|nr:hypothetical protein [bacterium]